MAQQSAANAPPDWPAKDMVTLLLVYLTRFK
jgi:hypothetical protein